MKLKISLLTGLLSFFILASFLMVWLSYINYQDHLSFCEEQKNELAQKIKNIAFDSKGNIIYDAVYVSQNSLYNGLCLERDGAPSKSSTTWGIATLIFIILIIFSWKIDKLSRKRFN